MCVCIQRRVPKATGRSTDRTVALGGRPKVCRGGQICQTAAVPVKMHPFVEAQGILMLLLLVTVLMCALIRDEGRPKRRSARLAAAMIHTHGGH